MNLFKKKPKKSPEQLFEESSEEVKQFFLKKCRFCESRDTYMMIGGSHFQNQWFYNGMWYSNSIRLCNNCGKIFMDKIVYSDGTPVSAP